MINNSTDSLCPSDVLVPWHGTDSCNKVLGCMRDNIVRRAHWEGVVVGGKVFLDTECLGCEGKRAIKELTHKKLS